MDAVWSAAVVAMAFLATMTLLESSGRSAARSAKSSQALIVAQNEINRMRNVGQRNEANLLAMNDTTETVTYRGANFEVNYTAIATAGINETPVEVCGVDYDPAGESSSLPDNAAFIYMRVDVNYLGGPTGSTGSTSGASEPGHATLDSHFASERSAEVNTDVGMLRVYTLDRADAPVTVSGVTLTKPDGTTKTADASNASKGCYLFSSLAAGAYTINVNTTLQDVYMTNAGSQVTRSYQMPTGVLRSTAMRLANPVKVTPTFKYNSSGEQSFDPANNTTNGFAVGPGGTANWVAMSNEIIKPPTGNPTFFLTPGGMFMPNSYIGNVDVSGNNSVDKAKMFPITTGYAGYAGPCRVNDPTSTNWVQVPNTGNVTWQPNGTLSPSPIFWLSVLKPLVSFTAAPGKPADGPNTNNPGDWFNPGPAVGTRRWRNWGQTFGTAKVQVALAGSNGSPGSDDSTTCRPGYTLGSTWQRIPGTVNVNGGGLGDIASALPPGRYNMCIQIDYTYRKQQQEVKVLGNSGWPFYWANSWGWRYIGSEVGATWNGIRQVVGQLVNYKANPNQPAVQFTAVANRDQEGGDMQSAADSCGNNSLWAG